MNLSAGKLLVAVAFVLFLIGAIFAIVGGSGIKESFFLFAGLASWALGTLIG